MLFLLSFRPTKYKMNNVAVDGNTCCSVSNQKLDEKKIHPSIDPRLETGWRVKERQIAWSVKLIAIP